MNKFVVAIVVFVLIIGAVWFVNNFYTPSLMRFNSQTKVGYVKIKGKQYSVHTDKGKILRYHSYTVRGFNRGSDTTVIGIVLMRHNKIIDSITN